MAILDFPAGAVFLRKWRESCSAKKQIPSHSSYRCGKVLDTQSESLGEGSQTTAFSVLTEY
jgi:hypothetical protein